MKIKDLFLKKNIVTNIIIGINIIVFILEVYLSNSMENINSYVLWILGAKENYSIFNGEYYRLITCMFLHGGIMHIIFNMYALYSIGSIVEIWFGKIKYIVIYFISGIMGSIMSLYFSESMSVGASGAIFGLLGCVLVIAIKFRGRIGKDFLINIAGVIGINIFIGLKAIDIDNFGHIGGLIGGIVITLIFLSNRRKIVK